MFMQGQRSTMFLWQCSSKVVAMSLRLDAFFMSLCHKEGSDYQNAVLTAHLGLLKVNVSPRDKEGSANGTAALTARL